VDINDQIKGTAD